MIDTGFQNSFLRYERGDETHILDQAHEWSQLRRTHLEISMINIINTLTDKPDWRDKIWDPEVCSRWTKEIKRQLSAADTRFAEEDQDMRNGPFYWGPAIDEKAAQFIIEELKHKSSTPDVASVLGLGGADILKSDTIIPRDFRKELARLIGQLEQNTPVDWHPGRVDVVRDLVHPSLYPLQFGQTRICDHTIPIETAFNYAGQGNITKPSELGEGYSQRFQWLPADLRMVGDRLTFVSYINNLDPSLDLLYSTIAELVQLSVPLWQECIATHRENKPRRVPCSDEEELWKVEENKKPPPPYEYRKGELAELEESRKGYNEEEAFQSIRSLRGRKWYSFEWHPVCPVMVWPSPQEFTSWKSQLDQEPAPPKLDLWSHVYKQGLQVIVKISSIHLTPENPVFDGTDLHVEGMANEHICATSIFYYDSHNITTARVSFSGVARMGLCSYGQDDYRCLEHVYDADFYEQPAIQDFGSVTTPKGRLLAFPNVFHHKLLPFELLDKTQPGHRKVVVLWLVNPEKRIISTANVPPQQPEPYQRMVEDLRQKHDSATVEKILSTLAKPMSVEEAKNARLELMAERKRDMTKHDSREHYYSFCEH